MSRRVGQSHHNRVRKDYSRRQLENPFYRQNKANQDHSRRLSKIVIYLIILFLVFAIWFFLASPVFNLKQIKVIGANRVNSVEIEQAVWSQADSRILSVFSQHNFWLFKRELAAKSIQERYHLASISVHRRLFHTLEVKIQERDYVFIWQEDGRRYYLDAGGNIVDEIYTTPELNVISLEASSTASSTAPLSSPSSDYPLIDNQSGTKVQNDQAGISAEYLSCALKLYQDLRAYDQSLFDSFIIDQEYDTFKLRLKNGVLVYFNPQEDCDKQIRNLMVLLKGEYRDRIKQKIDLRYGDKIFYE